jgi:Rieske Fe-S protein
MSTEHAHDLTTPSGQPSGDARCACPSRRDSLLAAGVVVAGAAGLSACGADSTVGAAASSAGSAAASAASAAISEADVPVGGGKIFEALKVVVTQPTAGDFKAFSAVCTHQGCTVSGVSNGVITCPCHGSAFDITTGAVRQGPATQPLPAKSVTVGADGISIT